MKVKIGPYINWVGPYQIADALCWWAKPQTDEWGFKSKADWVHDFGIWLAERKDGSNTWLTNFCNWIESKRKRQIYVKIDKYDTWSADHTLALIVLPMLRQLKATQHGAPSVDDADVPAPLRSTAPGARDKCENDWDTDDNWHYRWTYVLDEMIWAFEQHCDDNSTDKFYNHGVEVAGESFESKMNRIQIDEVGLKAHQARKQNAFQLFGKYYQNLWD